MEKIRKEVVVYNNDERAGDRDNLLTSTNRLKCVGVEGK